MPDEQLSVAADFALPPREVTPPRSPTASVLRIFLPIGVIVAVMVLIVNHRSSGIIGVVVAMAIFALLVGIELPLILRQQRRRLDQQMAKLPVGAIYMGRATMFATRGERRFPATGTILLDAHGTSWTKHQGTHPSFAASWDEIRKIRLGPQPGKLGTVGTLRLDLNGESTRAFTIPSYGRLATILQAHQ